MRKIFLAFILSICLLPSLASAQVGNWLADTLQGLLNQRAKQFNLKSVVAAIVFPDGSVWNGACGNNGNMSTSADILYEMGSNTKTFTSSMILQLADEGKLKLDDTIYKYLPVYPHIAYGITIRELLNHTSGIFNYTDNPAFLDFINGDLSQRVSVDTILEKWVDTMQFKPGSQWSYCNTNYILLGRIIEKLDGVSYDEALHKRILDKFGFKETFLDAYESYSMPKAGTWLSNGTYLGDDFQSFMSAAWSAGAIVATPRDLAKWAKALYRGDILPGHWLDSMRKTVPIGGGYSYGLGMFQHSLNGKVYPGHGGTTLQNSEMDYSLSSDFSCVTVVNEQGKGNQATAIQTALILLTEKLLPKTLGMNTAAPQYTFSCYPNPVKESFHVSMDAGFIANNPHASVNIYALSGALVKSIPLSQAGENIYRGNIPNGFYLMQICDEQGRMVFHDKLILQ